MSEALRLAKWIEEDMSCQGDAEIAAELRRLSAELEECQAQRRAAFRRIEEQDAELEKVRKDAERFDFVTGTCEVFLDGVQIGSNEDLDAAMKGTP